ncbi:MAG: hypothetical protein DRO14_06100 [Thermoprotei archaeon]|nr:MAG: hypothetical protein DRO14_06100 [Thermoprotei archaeon]
MNRQSPSEKTPKAQARPQINIIQAQSMVQSMQLAFQQISALLANYGIEMYFYKVKLYSKEAEEHKPIDEDCPDASLCIDYVVRVKCRDDYTCSKLREAIKHG